MKTYAEIKDIIVNKLGYKTLADYNACSYNTFKDETQPLTQEQLDELSPDKVNNYDFWRVADEVFGVDPVCNQGGGTTATLLDANRKNLVLADVTGCLGWVRALMTHTPNARVLEIGPGYGNFRNYLEVQYPHVSYLGVDVNPRIPQVIPAELDGTMPKELIKKDTADLIYSSNVFQHLSARQRSEYFKAASEMLVPWGGFVFSMLTVPDGTIHPKRGAYDENGRGYLHHYGQFTIVPYFNEVVAELMEAGFQLYAHQIRQQDKHTSFFWLKRPPKAPEATVAAINENLKEGELNVVS